MNIHHEAKIVETGLGVVRITPISNTPDGFTTATVIDNRGRFAQPAVFATANIIDGTYTLEDCEACDGNGAIGTGPDDEQACRACRGRGGYEALHYTR